MIDNILYDSFEGFILDVEVNNTGEIDHLLFDTFMQHFILEVGTVSNEVSYTF